MVTLWHYYKLYGCTSTIFNYKNVQNMANEFGACFNAIFSFVIQRIKCKCRRRDDSFNKIYSLLQHNLSPSLSLSCARVRAQRLETGASCFRARSLGNFIGIFRLSSVIRTAYARWESVPGPACILRQ